MPPCYETDWDKKTPFVPRSQKHWFWMARQLDNKVAILSRRFPEPAPMFIGLCPKINEPVVLSDPDH
jgi:hypothetical protein